LVKIGKLLRHAGWLAACATIIPAVALWAITWIPLDAAPFLRANPSPMLLDRAEQPLFIHLNPDDQWNFPESLERLGPRIAEATIAVEDKRFHQHGGLDFQAIARAALQNLQASGIRSGASTLTMQLVKLNGNPSHTVPGKIRQILLALRLERSLEKDRILEAYLNQAPYGRNIVGIEAAARRFFGKPARELTLPEAALLAGLPKAPSALSPLRHPERARARRNHVLERMAETGVINLNACREAQAKPLGAAWHPFPKNVPQLAQKLRSTKPKKARIATTLDGDLQRDAEARCRRYLRQFDNAIAQAAVIAVHVPTGEVRLRVGGVGYLEGFPGSHIDLCSVKRSPGSALKPFTYALAMEQNKLYPQERFLDGLLDYGGYQPTNFDKESNGLISATNALRQSLNVPAVQALNRLGAGPMHAFLRGSGLQSLNRSPEHYGLGLTLGGCEVTLEELAAAYAMLARGGVYRPLKTTKNASDAVEKRLLSPGTVAALFQMLEQPLPNTLPPGLLRPEDHTKRACWKTGTSSGFRDAWSVVFDAEYVVVVWLGNPDGKASRRLVGSHAALPLAAALFQGLEGSAWPRVKDDLQKVTLCGVTGLPAAPWCPVRAEGWIPKEQFLHRRCDVHRPTNAHWPGTPHGWNLARVGNPVVATPAPKSLEINSPAPNAEYVLTGQGDHIPVRASLSDNTPLYWYLDDQFLGETAPGGSLNIALKKGNHRVACMTPQGEIGTAQFLVSQPKG
jgi:penicillin-binding protein 1C